MNKIKYHIKTMRFFVVCLLSSFFILQCEYLSDPNLLRKSAEDTDDFKCSIKSPDADGIFKNKSYKYTVRCIAKKGKVRFINLKVSVLARSKSGGKMRSRALVEKRLRNAPIVVTPDRPFEYTGTLNVSGFGSRSGRRSLHASSVVDYPGLDNEQDKINNPWKYNMLTTQRL